MVRNGSQIPINHWDNPDEHPQKGDAINYPEGTPDLKHREKGGWFMDTNFIPYVPEAYRFKTISEFKTSMRHGAEVVIDWKGKEYGIWSENGVIRITCSDLPNESHIFENADAALEYMIGPDRLRDVITQVAVLDRTI